MKIDAVRLRELRMRLIKPFETSFGTTVDRRVLLVELHADGLTGWGEVTSGMGPYYNPETTDGAWHILRDFLVPLVLGKEIPSPSEIPPLLEAIRGYEMSKAALENAAWDIESQKRGVALAELLGGTRKEIPCGVSLGIHSDPGKLLDTISTELAAGYQRIKMKVKPGKDLEFVQVVRKKFPNVQLMIDANSAYSLSDAEHLKKFDEYNLTMIEQPLEWDDIYEHSRLQAMISTPVCLDESIHNLHQAKAAVALDACRVVNIKLGRVGGHTEGKRIQDFCHSKNVPVWCGGMLESGIGRAHNIAMSSLPGFVLPGDVSASRRYWDEDIIEPEVEVSSKGTIQVPTTPGLGYRVRQSRVDALTVREETFRAAGSTVAVPATL